jgi:hypothetical protein
MESEVDRAHMSTYIHHEEEAQGDEYWDEEEAPEYESKSIPHGHLPDDAMNSKNCYIPPDIQGAEYKLSDGSTLKDNLERISKARLSVFNTKVSPERMEEQGKPGKRKTTFASKTPRGNKTNRQDAPLGSNQALPSTILQPGAPNTKTNTRRVEVLLRLQTLKRSHKTQWMAHPKHCGHAATSGR